MIRNILTYFRSNVKIYQFNAFELLIALSINMKKRVDKRGYPSEYMRQFVNYYNLIFNISENFASSNVLHSHFERFVEDLIEFEIPKWLFANLEGSQSLNCVIETLQLITNMSEKSKKFRSVIYKYMFSSRDILPLIGEVIVGKDLILNLRKSLR